MSDEPIKRGMDRYVSDEMFQRENEEYRTSSMSKVYVAPVGGDGPWLELGTIDPVASTVGFDADGPFGSLALANWEPGWVSRSESFTVELGAVKMNRKALWLYFGDRVPRSDRALRRRRNNLRRKRINRRRNR